MDAKQSTRRESDLSAESRRYWVVGGTYTGTDFEEIATPEKREERFGPFATYRDALNEWARLAWRSADDCHSRYRIETSED